MNQFAFFYFFLLTTDITHNISQSQGSCYITNLHCSKSRCFIMNTKWSLKFKSFCVIFHHAKEGLRNITHTWIFLSHFSDHISLSTNWNLNLIQEEKIPLVKTRKHVQGRNSTIPTFYNKIGKYTYKTTQYTLYIFILLNNYNGKAQ